MIAQERLGYAGGMSMPAPRPIERPVASRWEHRREELRYDQPSGHFDDLVSRYERDGWEVACFIDAGARRANDINLGGWLIFKREVFASFGS